MLHRSRHGRTVSSRPLRCWRLRFTADRVHASVAAGGARRASDVAYFGQRGRVHEFRYFLPAILIILKPGTDEIFATVTANLAGYFHETLPISARLQFGEY